MCQHVRFIFLHLECNLLSEQLRAARAMARMDQKDLADIAAVSVETIKRLEKMNGDLSATRVLTLNAIQKALEAAGIEFTNGHQPGIRVRPTDVLMTQTAFDIGRESLEPKLIDIDSSLMLERYGTSFLALKRDNDTPIGTASILNGSAFFEPATGDKGKLTEAHAPLVFETWARRSLAGIGIEPRKKR